MVSVIIAPLSDQIVGEPLTLKCDVSAENEISGRIDFTWSNDNLVLQTVEGVTTTNSSQVFTDTYDILQLRTEDNGRIFNCEVVLSKIPLVVVSTNMTLEVTGKNNYKLLKLFTWKCFS